MRSLSTMEKALAVNLDPMKYGTIAEIGAGQEVARLFFQAGAASGTVAKTISAYDMQFSDAIYGLAPGGRYVVRPRLEAMLETEFDLVVQRIAGVRPQDSTFFAFADTVATQGYKKRADCHGWMGVRFQPAPSADPDDVIIHVRLLDDTAIEQQQAVGILGVNLIYGAYFLSDDPVQLVRSLFDDIEPGRLEIDMIDFRGPIFDQVDERLMAIELVTAGLSTAALISPTGDSLLPGDAFYKKHTLVMRGAFQPVLTSDLDMFSCGRERFLSRTDATGAETVMLAEIPLSDVMADGALDSNDILARIEQLGALGFNVLLTSYRRFFELRQYLARYSRRGARILVGIDDLREIFTEPVYDDLTGGVLQALGYLFAGDTKLYVYPALDGDGAVVSADDLTVADDMGHLYAHFRERELIVPLTGYSPDCLHVDPAAVRRALTDGTEAWKAGVPPQVHPVIINRNLARAAAG